MLCQGMHFFSLLSFLFFSIVPIHIGSASEGYTRAREELVKKIESTVRSTRFYLNRSKLDPKVMDALRKVPRHEFVPSNLKRYAYENRPLPIGHGQTISQPYIVALMTDLIEIEKDDKVLEIGTGSGYQAAILSELVKEVYSIEIIEPLKEGAQQRFKALGYDNIQVLLADGYYGWPKEAPFDAIMVTAASSHIPPPLIQQLKKGGKMIIPVGGQFMTQHLIMVEKDKNGSTKTRQILPVRFVPLTGRH